MNTIIKIIIIAACIFNFSSGKHYGRTEYAEKIQKASDRLEGALQQMWEGLVANHQMKSANDIKLLIGALHDIYDNEEMQNLIDTLEHELEIFDVPGLPTNLILEMKQQQKDKINTNDEQVKGIVAILQQAIKTRS